MEEWAGAVNYIAHHGVVKPQSHSTALCVVSNSSLKNDQSGGLSYNDILPKGPNALNLLLQVLVTWRSHRNVVTWDYSKVYNTVETFAEEMHMCRLVWKCGGKEWRTFGITKMHFGDRPAAAALEVAKSMVAELGCHIDSEAANMLKKGYIDDGTLLC